MNHWDYIGTRFSLDMLPNALNIHTPMFDYSQQKEPNIQNWILREFQVLSLKIETLYTSCPQPVNFNVEHAMPLSYTKKLNSQKFMK